MRKQSLLPILAAAAVAAAARAQGGAEALHELFRDHHRWEMTEFPEMAMARGNYAHADRITDTSLRAIEQRHAERQAFLERLFAIDRAGLGQEDQLNYDLFELMLTTEIQGHRFRTFLAPVGGRFGPHQEIPQMAERVRFRDQRDYESYLARLERVPRLVEDTIELLRLGVQEERTLPRVTLEELPAQFDAILAGGLDALREPFDRVPETIAPDRREALERRLEQEVLPGVEDAVRKLGEFVARKYIPSARDTIAAHDLPDGADYYAHQLRVMTTTGMTAAEIHQLGLQEVQRIKAEMREVIRASSFMDERAGARELGDEVLFDAFLQFLRTDPRFYCTDPDELLVGYRDICKQVDPWLPKLFSVLPRLPYGVRAIPDFMAPTQTTAYYDRGDIRNAEPGWFYANTFALDQRPRYEMVALALHEAVPGHHLQIALAQELDGLPEFRKDAYLTAFGEGWALYAERLGLEMGLYQDPYDNFGRLLYEMWRACRLVVDTGMHAFSWSRARAIQFVRANTALSELNIANEVDRYISWPGQACGYKIGELKIRQLREKAQAQLGKAFDLRQFHDQVLGAGPLPLTVLEQRIDRWIKARRMVGYD